MSTAVVPAARRPALTPAADGPLWVSVEGLNGAGKTCAITAVVKAWGPGCLSLSELTDQDGDTPPGRVIGALSAAGDEFLRTGHPEAETFALLALKIREFERLRPEDLPGVQVILEDRGVDTVAVYQAAIITGDELGDQDGAALRTARAILRTAATWRPPAHATILLREDRATATARFTARTGAHLTEDDHRLIARIEALYDALAEASPDRYHVLDVTGFSPECTAAALQSACRDLLQAREAGQ